MKFVNLILGLPRWEFSTGKKHFTQGKKTKKNDFAPSEKYSSDASEDVTILAGAGGTVKYMGCTITRPEKYVPGGVLNFELGTDVWPKVSTTTL